MNRTSHAAYFLVGLFVLAMVGGLVIVLTTLTGGSGEMTTYYTHYRNVAGLKFGTPVFFEGFLAGQVEAITPEVEEGQSGFRVTLQVKSELALPDDSVALITQPNLLSGRAISIRAGRSPTALEPGAEIDSGSRTGLAALPELVGDGQTLLTEGTALLQQINSAVGTISTWLQEDFPRLTRQYETLPGSLHDQIGTIAVQTEALVRDARDVVKQSRRLVNEDNVANVSATLENIRLASERMEVVSRDFATLNANIQEVSRLMRVFMTDNKTDMEQAVIDLRYSLDMIAKRVDAVTFNLEGTSQNLFEFSRQLRINPSILLGGETPIDEASQAR